MGNRFTRHMVATGVATVTALTLAAPASAHFCFKQELNDHARQGMLGSGGWVSLHDLLYEFTELCDAGITILAAAGGATPDTPIHAHAVMAGGTLRKGPDGGNKAIGHLDFEALDAAFPAAVAACD